jgi:hypothetical protein
MKLLKLAIRHFRSSVRKYSNNFPRKININIKMNKSYDYYYDRNYKYDQFECLDDEKNTTYSPLPFDCDEDFFKSYESPKTLEEFRDLKYGICEYCNGALTLPCMECHGSKLTAHKCPACLGTKVVLCRMCGGSGHSCRTH